MNAIFITLITISGVVLLFSAPENFISAMQSGANEAITLSVTLLAIYAVWLGVFEILTNCGLSDKLSYALRKPLRFIFGDMGEAEESTCLNVSANLLGLGGIATPMGIKAASIYDKADNEYAKSMLFVLSATSIQLLPVSVISLRSAFFAQSPSDIILPTLLCTALSATIGILLVKILVKK